MNNIKKIREILGYSTEQFAKLLSTTPSAVCAWEDGSAEPNYDALKSISLLFHLSSDFVKGTGIFEKWDLILEYYDAVSSKLQSLIPDGFFLPTFCEDKFFTVWLDTRRYYDPDELELARWFAFAVQDIQITPTGENPDEGKTADVDIEFTPAFTAINQIEWQNVQNKPRIRSRSIIQFTDNDGIFIEHIVPKSREQVIKEFLDSLDRSDDENV